jgi:hypothetical protein
MSIFSTSRIRFSELYNDSIQFVKNTYDSLAQNFTMASPMGQLLQVILHFGRMILFYIEDSITELNIKTATRPQSVRGLASLTGHNPSRATAARGTLRLAYNGTQIQAYASIVTIPNYTKLSNTQNGLTYTIVLPGEEVRLSLTSQNNFIDVDIIQGTLEFQQATGTGDPLQSFNFQTKKGASVDNYYVNVYVDGKPWPLYDSILDMTLDQEGCIVRTGQTGGVDVFFGNFFNGKVPRMGSVILIEYLITDGDKGNISGTDEAVPNSWKFSTTGFALNGDQTDLNSILNVSVINSVIFGTLEEPLYLTRLLAPNMSRSFVLANANNYIYFLRKLNLFTIIDAIPGFATFQDQFALDKYNQANTTYQNINSQYLQAAATFGLNSNQATTLKTQVNTAQGQLYYYQNLLNAQKQDDNTVYLFLVPDVNKRISTSENYYTTAISVFLLSDNEKTALMNLIEESGQRILTVDNAILNLQYPRFNLNMSLILYEGFNYDDVRQSIISVTSDYFLKNTRRDRIPVSDIVRIIEGVTGVDSVNVWFDADVNNLNIYSTFYGIDDYGDIILERFVKDAFGNSVGVKDIYPLIRGGFTNSQGTFYEDSLAKNKLSTLNISVRGYTTNDLNSDNNKLVMNSLGA